MTFFSSSALSYLRFVISAWAAAGAAIALASAGAAILPPLDLLNQIAPFWLALALAGAALAWFSFAPGRARATALGLFGLAALTHAALIAPEFARSMPRPISPAADAPRVRVVWLNAQSGQTGASVHEYLLSTNADFILLSEFHDNQRHAPELVDAYPHWSRCVEPHGCDVVILSRHAALAARPEQEVSTSGLRVVWADFDVGGAPLRLVATHLRRPYPAAQHVLQRAELLSLLATSPRDGTILAGDFNATPWSFALKQIDAQSGLTRYDRAMTTWPATAWTRLRLPAPEAFMPIDHVYAGENWRLVSIRRGPRTGADHFPIEAEFVWRHPN